MNWRDSIWAQTRSRGRRSRCVKLATQRRVTYERELLGKNSEIIKTIAVWLTLIVHIDRDEQLFA